MISVKEAVGAALAYVSDFQELIPNKDLRLEETELDEEDGRPIWLITLSFGEIGFGSLGGLRSNRIFKIDADNGRVISMRARTSLPSRS